MDKKLCTDSLKAKIRDLVSEQLFNDDAEMVVRSQFCGAKFDFEKLLSNNFYALEVDGQGTCLGMLVDDCNQKHEIRIFVGESGYLRDIRFYLFDISSDIASIRMSAHKNKVLLEMVDSILAECIVESAPQTALDDFEPLRDNFDVTEQHKSKPRETQLGIIWKERLTHWVDNHPATAARFVVAAARHPDFCRSGTAMAKAAFHAYELALHGEFYIIFNASLNLDTDNDDPEYWNWIGCVTHRLDALEFSVSSFIEAIKANPTWELARKNAWLVGRSLIKKKLEEKDFKSSLEYIDQLMEYYEGIDNEDRALMMASTGLCCEGLGFLEDAGHRYKLAFEMNENCLVARFGINRITSDKDDERVQFFDIQLKSFPRIPHEQGIGDKVPVEFIEGYSHGDHWDAVTTGAKEFITNYLPLAVEKSEPRSFAVFESVSWVGRPADGAFFFAYPPSGIILGGILVVLNPLTGDKEVWSGYPYVPEGDPVGLEVISLEEWNNGVEGSVIVNRGGGGELTFFDPLFFENKNVYLKDTEYEFILSGFACRIVKTEKIVHKMTSGAGYEMERMRREQNGDPMKDGETYDVEIGEHSTIMSQSREYPGEYEFIMPVEGVEYTEFLGEKIVIVRTHINDEKRDIPLKIYAAKHLLEEEVRPGDLVAGYLWLQGYLKTPEGTTVSKVTGQEDDHWLGKISFKIQDSDTLDQEFNYVFKGALNSIDSVRSFADMPFRIGDEPQWVVESVSGDHLFVRGVFFDMEMETWEEQYKKAQKDMEHPWISTRISPVFILGIGYTKAGEGHAFTYFGWEKFETALGAINAEGIGSKTV